MKILLLADLHSDRPWYRWILSELAHYDLVCVAGDLIDMFKRTEEQIEFLREQWLPPFLDTGKPLAVCSGNHDFSIAPWLSAMPYPRVIADGQSEVVKTPSGEGLIVTTCPYFYSFNESDKEMTHLWRSGADLRQRHKARWLVLHHEPPEQFTPERVINKLHIWIERFSPDYVSTGHFHESTEKLGRFSKKIGSTWCFNSGCVPGALIPSHIILDTLEGTALWNAMTSDGFEITETVLLS
ncbi:MAG: metallophosphoesterase [Verrucomicrobiota bacterium]|nr:metallophosphoesterase [Verrucomicrobiota bacterium]